MSETRTPTLDLPPLFYLVQWTIIKPSSPMTPQALWIGLFFAKTSQGADFVRMPTRFIPTPD